MPFQPGHKLAPGGKREGAGRKPVRDQLISDEIKLSAKDYVRQELDKHVGRVMQTYLKLASSGRDPTTTRHAVDKIAPDEKIALGNGITTINFIQFNAAPSVEQPAPIDVTPSTAPRITFVDDLRNEGQGVENSSKT